MIFLDRLNVELVGFEYRVRGRGYKTRKRDRFYFVIGAPRAGTTLATQLLVIKHNWRYITNIAARFWMAPLVGVKLSEQIAGKHPDPGVKSKYARTTGPTEIHEFGKFWQKHLGFNNSRDVKDFISPEHFDLTREALLAISRHVDSPMVMKGIYPAYVHKQVQVMLGTENVVWYNVERDPLDCCESIMNARLKARGRKSKWFGWYPPKELYEQWVDFQPEYQIAYQVAYFRRFYGSIATKTVTLEDLCKDYRLELNTYGDEREKWRGIYEEAEEEIGLPPA